MKFQNSNNALLNSMPSQCSPAMVDILIMRFLSCLSCTRTQVSITTRERNLGLPTHKGDTHWQFRLFPPHIIPYYKYFTSTILLRNGGFGSFFRIYNFTTNTLLLQCYHEHSTLLIGDIQRRLRLFLPHWRRQALKVSKVLLYSKLHY